MYSKLIVLNICLLWTLISNAQNEAINIYEDFQVTQLMDHRKALNFLEDRKIKAWSVQVYISRDKYQALQKVSEIKNRTRNLDTVVDWFYEAPYYRIYAGAFYTKIEASTLLHRLLFDFPESIIFKNAQTKVSDL